MVAAPTFGPQSTRLVGFRVPDGYVCHQLSIGTGLERREEVGLIVWLKTTEDVLENNVARWLSAFGVVNVVAVEPRVRFVVSRQQSAQCVDHCGFSDIVGADQDVQARLEVKFRLLQFPEIQDVQLSQVQRRLLSSLLRCFDTNGYIVA
ncbi:hypothetical protein D3C71_1009930 [compost metagenome]